jgi:hypothetical protein
MRFFHSRDPLWGAFVPNPKGLIICTASVKTLSLRDDQDRKPSRRESIPAGKERRWREEARAEAVAADLEELRRLFGRNVLIPYAELTPAIDDYVEKLTGDRRTLHAPNHSLG